MTIGELTLARVDRIRVKQYGRK